MLRNFLLVGAGGAVGAMLRYGITLLFQALEWSTNVGTSLTNVVGSFLMGLLVGAVGQSPVLLLLTVGLCGGFTTFSTFSMQTVTLLQQGKWLAAAIYILATVLLCILFAFLGYTLGHKLA